MQTYSYKILLLFFLLSLIGFLTVPRLSWQLQPAGGGNQLRVSYEWPGASPGSMELQVTSPLEGVLSTMPEVVKIESVSGYHSAFITLTLAPKTDVDRLRFEVAAHIRQVYSRLPLGVSYPSISIDSPEESKKQQPFMILQVNGQAAVSELTEFAENSLKPRLAGVEGLYSIEVRGSEQKQWRVSYVPEQLQALQLSKADLVEALQVHGLRQQVGWLRANDRLLSLTVESPDVTEFPNVLLRAIGGRLVRLTDVATVQRVEARPESYFRVNGRNAVQLVLTTRKGANQLETSTQIGTLLRQLQAQFPPTYGLRTDYDAADYIRENLYRMAWQSGAAVTILLLVVALSIRNFRYLLLIIGCLLVNLLLSALLFYVLGVNMHLYSLAALTVSLGLQIDNAIVMIDHYLHSRNRSVFRALLGATLTTCAALTVIWFLPEQARRDLLEFSKVLIITLSVSLVVAYWFVPVALERMGLMAITMRRPGRWVVRLDRLYGRFVVALVRFRGVVLTTAFLAFGLPIFLLPTRIEGEKPNAQFYNNTLGSEWFQENLRPLLDTWLGGSLRLFVNHVFESYNYSSNERTLLYVNAGLPNQSTVEQMNDLLKGMETEVAKEPGVERFITQVYNGQQGGMAIYFKKEAEAGSIPYRLKARLIARSLESSGVDWDIYGVGQGFSQHLGANTAPTFDVLLRGYNYEQLEVLTQGLADKLLVHPRIQKVDINRVPGMYQQKTLEAYIFSPEKDELIRQGGQVPAYYAAVGERFNARPVPDLFRLAQNRYEGVVVAPLLPGDLWQLRHSFISAGAQTKHKSTDGQIERQPVAPQIRKENQQYLRQLSFEYFGSHTFGSEFLNETLRLYKGELPLGYTLERSEFNWWLKAGERQYQLIGVVLLAIFIIGAVLFESLRQPLWMILQIPLSFTGIFLAFYIFEFSFDQGGYASFLLVAGLVVNATIFVMNEKNQQQRFVSPLRGYRRAVRYKIRPILLSILTTVTGLLPFLLLGADQPFWPALAMGTSGGLLFSIVILLAVLPVMLLEKDDIA
ncbi:efflux RND transporter permease subunit [Arundinibacter roseus]|uniref:Efflux RND transporter permease subunit n=1 Tax=Arundinibacter roseus TaxID=2070510 RepID=A0A4R4KGY7_9BACT|nr:efflux RND transporter permease subunit [Arundinibacter roseus]TDB65809.1 efflux RND transporter permease subunit [Arundinibacter roseus]